MKRKNRLTGSEIRSIRSPRRVHSGLFSVSISPTVRGEVRVACVVSKKVARSAVKRNTLKRRMRAAVDTLLPSMPRAAYIFFARKDASRASYREIESEMRSTLRGA